MLKNSAVLFKYLEGKMSEVSRELENHQLQFAFSNSQNGSFIGSFKNEGLSMEIVCMQYEHGAKAILLFRFYSLKWHKGFTHSLSTFYKDKECEDFDFSFPTTEEQADRAIEKLLFLVNRDAQPILAGDDFAETFYDIRLLY